LIDNENLQQLLTLWVNVSHKLWEAKSKLLPKTEEHPHSPVSEQSFFSPEVLATYDGLNSLFLEAEQKKREILGLMTIPSSKSL